jgi:hypothetical protein
VFDQDTVVDDKMGQVVLPLNELYPSKGDSLVDLKKFDNKKEAKGYIVFRITL